MKSSLQSGFFFSRKTMGTGLSKVMTAVFPCRFAYKLAGGLSRVNSTRFYGSRYKLHKEKSMNDLVFPASLRHETVPWGILFLFVP